MSPAGSTMKPEPRAPTAMYHFMFVPSTLGLSVLLAMMESIYVTAGRTIRRDMPRFWGMLFGINFATGTTMEFQFGTNRADYAQYIGGRRRRQPATRRARHLGHKEFSIWRPGHRERSAGATARPGGSAICSNRPSRTT
jgi:hypothetical protein